MTFPMKRTLPFALTAFLSALPAVAELETYTVDPLHTFPSYEVSHCGYSMQRGRFNRTSGKISLDVAARKCAADMSYGLPALGDEVKLRINVEATKD